MKITMFSGSGFAWRVLLGCAVKGVAWEEEHVEASQQGLKSPQMLALNPRGKVPVLRDGDFTLSESSAILAWLDRKYPEPSLFGTTAEETGLIWRMILDFDLYVAPEWIKTIVAPIFTGQIDEQADLIQSGAAKALEELGQLEKRITDREWFVGDCVSAADIAVYPLLEGVLRLIAAPGVEKLHLEISPLGEHCPKLDSWRGRIQAIPGYELTYPAYWRQLDQAQPAPV